jgi:hypothetical protein
MLSLAKMPSDGQAFEISDTEEETDAVLGRRSECNNVAVPHVFFGVPEAFRDHKLYSPTCPELVRATSETLSEGTNLAGHG